MRKLRFAGVASVVAVAVAAGLIVWWPGSAETVAGRQFDQPAQPRPTGTAELPAELPTLPPQLDLSAANRRAPVPGLPDWSHAGYREGAGLPTEKEVTGNADCVLTAAELTGTYGVRPDDGEDDTSGLQKAIDHVRSRCSPHAGYDELSLIELPKGELAVSRQIALDADYLILRGAGDDPRTGTRVVFRPDENTRYDTVSDGDWDEDAMSYEDGKGGWLWPGRGLFRVQSRAVHEDYQDDYDSAPANRKDLFEGTVNVHWKAGIPLAAPARAGDTTIELAKKPKNIETGGYVNVRAANTEKFYAAQQALPTDHGLQNLHMRQQIFRVVAVDGKTVTLDKPLEFDVPVDSTSDGSAEIKGKTYASKVSPLVDPVLGVGIENLFLTQVLDGHDTSEATHEYGNISPADAMNGIVFKWAVNGWVRGVTTYFTGSHPVVTEEAKNLEIVGNRFVGSWNKGKGGNGYLRGSRVWDSVYAGNTLRGLRHFTFQWSAADNVFAGNDTDSDVNFHGGWERNNLVEHNAVAVPYEHKPGSCTQNCGGEGGDAEDSAWFPIWWGAGKKAVKWSGATGPRNVVYANTMSKQTTAGGPYTPYYDNASTVYQFGWDGHAYHHLSVDGAPIADWAGHEQADFTGGDGVDTSVTAPGPSLFLTTLP